MQRYSPEIEQTMRDYYATLSEKDRRRYAGVEALKLGRGGVAYIAGVLGCRRKTVRVGREEVQSLRQAPPRGGEESA